ncbi:MAG: site-specific DNA-methyltransferase [Nitrosopumilaceae archaeon]
MTNVLALTQSQKLENTIFNQDCIDGMRLIPTNHVDLIITDPPFAIDFKAARANYNRKKSNVLEGYNEIKQKDYYEFSYRWLKEAYRILKDSGSMFVFSGWTNIRDILNAICEVEFELINEIIWKYQFGVVTKNKFVSSHYHCLYVCKNDSKRRFYRNCRFMDGSERYRDMEDVWIIKREYWRGEKKTPTKLPSEIIRKILQYASLEGDLVLDPFLGSGQVAVVSKEMNRKYLGFEIVKEYFDFAKERLNNKHHNEI